jgi:hypothetical protein
MALTERLKRRELEYVVKPWKDWSVPQIQRLWKNNESICPEDSTHW